MNKMKENKIITDTIRFLEKGSYLDREPYMKDLYDVGAKMNGYRFQKDVWCLLIWRPTNIRTEPQFKGEDLVKVVPLFTRIDKIPDVLNSQPWTYL